MRRRCADLFKSATHHHLRLRLVRVTCDVYNLPVFMFVGVEHSPLSAVDMEFGGFSLLMLQAGLQCVILLTLLAHMCGVCRVRQGRCVSPFSSARLCRVALPERCRSAYPQQQAVKAQVSTSDLPLVAKESR